MANVIFLPVRVAGKPAKRGSSSRKSAHVHMFIPSKQCEYAQRKVVCELESLLHHARRGRISGLVWAASSPPGTTKSGNRFAMDLVGECVLEKGLGFDLAIRLARKALAVERGDAVPNLSAVTPT